MRTSSNIVCILSVMALALYAPAAAAPTSTRGGSASSSSSSPSSVSRTTTTTTPSSNKTAFVDFTSCTDPDLGEVYSVAISPCERSGDDEPCRFRHHRDYTITLEYMSRTYSSNPVATLTARDDSVSPSTRYPYSGQSFAGCQYTECPVKSMANSTYTYNFKTLQSRFNYLTFNVTSDRTSPPFLCAGFPVQFIPSVTGRTSKGASPTSS